MNVKEEISIHPTEYDESDDLEAAKASIEKKLKEEFVKEILKDKKLAENLDKIANAKNE